MTKVLAFTQSSPTQKPVEMPPGTEVTGLLSLILLLLPASALDLSSSPLLQVSSNRYERATFLS